MKEDLLSVREALDVLLKEFHSLQLENVKIANAFQRVLGENVLARDDIPSFDNSSMDGFAVLARDTVGAAMSSPVKLKVVADIPAGSLPDFRMESGQD